MKNKQIWVTISSLVVIGLIIGGFWYLNRGKEITPSADEINSPTTPSSKTIPIKTSVQKIKEDKTYRGMTYQALVKDFSGRRFQLDNCQASPTTVTFKNETEIMLDGLSADPQIITIGSQTVTLEGFDVAFMKVSSATLPATLTIDCRYLDQPQYNIATILLQS